MGVLWLNATHPKLLRQVWKPETNRLINLINGDANNQLCSNDGSIQRLNQVNIGFCSRKTNNFALFQLTAVVSDVKESITTNHQL